jgi:hypothetical protein
LEKRFKALRYVTSSAAAPCSKMRFFRKNNRLHNTHAPSQTEKKRRTLSPRARAQIRRRRRRRRKICTRVREEDALKDAAAFFLAELEKEEEER